MCYLVCVVGRIVVWINDELEEEFRRLVAETFGARRGTLSRAVEQAIRLWIQKVRTRRNSSVSFRSFEIRPKKKVPKDLGQRILRELREAEEEKLEKRVIKP